MWWSQDGLFERTAGSLEIWFLVLTWLLVTLDTSDQSGSRFPQRLSDLKQQPFYYILWFYTEIQPMLGWVVFSLVQGSLLMFLWPWQGCLKASLGWGCSSEWLHVASSAWRAQSSGTYYMATQSSETSVPENKTEAAWPLMA